MIFFISKKFFHINTKTKVNSLENKFKLTNVLSFN